MEPITITEEDIERIRPMFIEAWDIGGRSGNMPNVLCDLAKEALKARATKTFIDIDSPEASKLIEEGFGLASESLITVLRAIKVFLRVIEFYAYGLNKVLVPNDAMGIATVEEKCKPEYGWYKYNEYNTGSTYFIESGHKGDQALLQMPYKIHDLLDRLADIEQALGPIPDNEDNNDED